MMGEHSAEPSPANMTGGFRLECPVRLADRDIEDLTGVLLDCVEGGASVSFMWPLSHERAMQFWREAAAGVQAGERRVLLARDASGALIGTATLMLKQPDNQQHRADVAKMLVRRSARHRGVGKALLAAVEQAAADAGRSLLVLDTVTDTDAHRLYAASGWQRVGEIPDYAHWPDGRPCPTTIFYRKLRIFRAFRQSDEGHCLRLFDANCPEYFAPGERDEYAAFLSAASPSYRVCVEGAQVIGAFGLLHAGPGEGRLNWILIDPGSQGTGLGSAMMADVKRAACADRMHTVHIAASHRSAPFFARFGASAEREARDGWGPGMHRIDMRWKMGTDR